MRKSIIVFFFLSSFLFHSCGNSFIDKALLDDISKMENALIISGEMVVKNSGHLEKSIAKTVREGGSKPADLEVLNKAINIRKSTSEVRAYIDQLKKQIIQSTGGYVEPDSPIGYKGSSDISTTESIMIGSDQGPAAVLKHKTKKCFNDYGKIMGRKYNFMPLEPTLFKGKPMVVTMANLTRLEFELLTFENNILQELGAQVGTAF